MFGECGRVRVWVPWDFRTLRESTDRLADLARAHLFMYARAVNY
jgi:hypothetical protein